MDLRKIRQNMYLKLYLLKNWKTCQQKQEDIIQTQENQTGWTLEGQENDLSSKLKSFTETIEINNAEIAEIDREILTIQEELELESISEEEKPKLEEEKHN